MGTALALDRHEARSILRMLANEHLLDARLAQLDTTGARQRLRTLICEADDRDVFRINPCSFAEREGIPERDAIELMLRATAAGVLRAEWLVFCRGCGEYAIAHLALCDLDSAFRCDACARVRATSLDEQVEVRFTVAPDIRDLRYARPATLDLEDYFFTYKFSTSILVRGDGVRLVDYLRRGTILIERVAAGDRAEVEVDLTEGWVIGSPRAMVTVTGAIEHGARTVELSFDGHELLPRPTVAPGRVRLVVHNRSASAAPFLLYVTPIVTYFEYLPMLTGQRLLNTSDYRRFLRTDVVRPGTGIPTRDCTLLFTDLAGSTALYERIGDAAAFELVTAHFEALARVVTRNAGALVKTIGDAVMASFTRPADAIRAAIEMRESLAGAAEPLRLKIGVHRGPCLVVNTRDQLDYFGRTVNLAARVQGVARAGELCVTEPVFDDPAARAALAPAGAPQSALVTLRGIPEPQLVHRFAL